MNRKSLPKRMRRETGWRAVFGGFFVLVVLGWGGADSHAQTGGPDRTGPSEGAAPFCTEPPGSSVDLQGLALVYCDSPAGVAASLRGAHATARPVFYGAVPAAWLGAGLTNDLSVGAAAYRLTLSQGLTYGLVLGAKRAVGRSRPYVDHPLQPRSDRHKKPLPSDAHLSFPSGHASVSAAIATSWSLSYPRWYVIAPGALWASGVAMSRVYLGVHYPSDIFVGTVLGTGVALLVHQLRSLVTPSPLQGSSAQALRAPPLVLRVQF